MSAFPEHMASHQWRSKEYTLTTCEVATGSSQESCWCDDGEQEQDPHSLLGPFCLWPSCHSLPHLLQGQSPKHTHFFLSYLSTLPTVAHTQTDIDTHTHRHTTHQGVLTAKTFLITVINPEHLAQPIL